MTSDFYRQIKEKFYNQISDLHHGDYFSKKETKSFLREDKIMSPNFYQQIEEEFDDRWEDETWTNLDDFSPDKESVKSFLRSALERQARKIIEEIEKYKCGKHKKLRSKFLTQQK